MPRAGRALSRRPVIRVLSPGDEHAVEVPAGVPLATEFHELASGDAWALGISSRPTCLLTVDDVDATLPLADGKVGCPTIELNFREMRHLADRLQKWSYFAEARERRSKDLEAPS